MCLYSTHIVCLCLMSGRDSAPLLWLIFRELPAQPWRACFRGLEAVRPNVTENKCNAQILLKTIPANMY